MDKGLVCVVWRDVTYRVGGLCPRGWSPVGDRASTDARVTTLGVNLDFTYVKIEFDDNTKTILPFSQVILGYGPI